MEWTDEKRAELAACWADGMTAFKIGLRLGCSKSSVLGERRRMGLPKRQERGVIGQCGCAKWQKVAAERDELLAALEAFVAMGEQYDWDGATTGRQMLMADARAAIARAKGKQS